MLLLAGPVWGEESLPASVEVPVLKVAEQQLGAVERALKATPGVDARAAANVTLGLQTFVEEALGAGSVTLYPRAIYELCLRGLRAGKSRAAISDELVAAHKKGDLARAPVESAAPPVEVKRKIVPSMILDKERTAFVDPHLTPKFLHDHRGETLTVTYLLCLDANGRVERATVIKGNPEVDSSLIEQIKATWIYKKQPSPVCSPNTFVFDIQ